MVQWTAEKDQILLQGVFQFCDIKASAPLLKHLAELVGEDCTPKAVSHRLNNIRNSGKTTKPAGGSGPTTPAKPTLAKITGSTARGRGRGRARARAPASKSKAINEDNVPEDDDETLLSPSVSRKRGRKAKSDEVQVDDEPPLKITKKEEDEDDFSSIIGDVRGNDDAAQDGEMVDEI